MNEMNFEALFRICGTGLLAAFAAVILRDIRKEYTAALLLCMSVLALLSVLPVLEESVAFVRKLTQNADSGYVGVILRGVGITYLTGISCEICRSAGENGIAGTIETVGRAELLLMCLPLFGDLASLALM